MITKKDRKIDAVFLMIFKFFANPEFAEIIRQCTSNYPVSFLNEVFIVKYNFAK